MILPESKNILTKDYFNQNAIVIHNSIGNPNALAGNPH